MNTREELKEKNKNHQEKMLHSNLKYLDLSKVFSDLDLVLDNYKLRADKIKSSEQRRASLLARLLLLQKRRLILLSHKINNNHTNKGSLEELSNLRRQKLEILHKLENNINKLRDILEGCVRSPTYKSSNFIIKLKLTKKTNPKKVDKTDFEEQKPKPTEIKKHKKRVSVSYAPSSRVPISMFEDNFFLEFGDNGVSRKSFVKSSRS